MEENRNYSLGIDVGSTTAKVVLTDGEKTIYEKYARHNSAVVEKTAELLNEIKCVYGDINVKVALSGSAGLGLSEKANIAFVQEVYALINGNTI